MPLNRISKDSEASNAPESLKTTRTLKLHADNAILKFKKQTNKQTKKTTSGFGELKKKKKKVTIERSLIQGARGKYPLSPVNSSVLSFLLFLASPRVAFCLDVGNVLRHSPFFLLNSGAVVC